METDKLNIDIFKKSKRLNHDIDDVEIANTLMVSYALLDKYRKGLTYADLDDNTRSIHEYLRMSIASIMYDSKDIDIQDIRSLYLKIPFLNDLTSRLEYNASRIKDGEVNETVESEKDE